MRLSADQVSQGILHPDIEVRDMVLEYFQLSMSEDATIMLLFIQAYEKYGWEDVCSYFLSDYRIVQTPETVQWLIDRVQDPEPDAGPTVRWTYRGDFLSTQLAIAPLKLLDPHRDTLQNLAELESKHKDDIYERFAMELMSPEDAWDELEALCEVDGYEDPEEFEYDQARRYVEVAARGGDRLKARILETLAKDLPDKEADPQHYLLGYAAELVGRGRWHEAISRLNELLSADAAASGERLPQFCAEALVQIGTDELIEMAAGAYSEETLDYQIEIQPVFQSIHTDSAIRIGYELLKTIDQDEDILFVACDSLAISLLKQFDPDLVEPLRTRLNADPNVESAGEIRKALVVVASVAGITFPEFDEWHAAMRAATTEFRKSTAGLMRKFDGDEDDDEYEYEPPSVAPRYLEDELDEYDEEGAAANEFGSGDPLEGLATYSEVAKLRAEPSEFEYDPIDKPFVRLDPKVGRNDPCPCGSGKKFKKCCLNRE